MKRPLPPGGATWRTPPRLRWPWPRARPPWQWSRARLMVVGALVATIVVGLTVVYPLVGRWMIRTRVVAALEARFGAASIAGIDVGLGHAVLTDVRLGDPTQGLQIAIDRIDIELSTWRSLVGSVEVDQVRLRGVTARLDQRGEDRVRGLGGDRGRGGRRLPRPGRIVIDDLTVEVVAPGALGTWRVAVAHAVVRPRGKDEVRDVVIDSPAPLAVRVRVPVIDRDQAGAVTWSGGDLLSATVALAGLAGSARRDAHGRLAIDGEAIPSLLGRAAAPQAWRLSGWLGGATSGELTIASRKLDGSPAALRLALDADGLAFDGDAGLPTMQIEHPAVSDQPFTAAPIDLVVRGRYHRTRRELEVPVLTLTTAGVAVEAAGTLALAGGRETDGRRRPKSRFDARVAVPPTPCDRVLHALPAGLVPTLAGYRLAGTFALELHAAVDWSRIHATEIDGHGGLAGCQVVAAPAVSPTMLTGGFTLRREVSPGAWIDVEVGPRAKGYVRHGNLSPFVIDSLIETEDPNFNFHDGLDAGGLRRALIANLEAGRFRIGSSTITMQLAKNVFLHGRKTLSRKLQELVLAWHIEQVLGKPKIFELYVNVIEFGPGIYGLGAASRHYFGKSPLDLDPKQAAFFSAIVPRPTMSYQCYCSHTLDELTRDKVRRALSLLVNAGHITSDEWREANLTRLEFRRATGDTEAACMSRRDAAFAVLRSSESQPP